MPMNINVNNILSSISQLNHILNETITLVKMTDSPCPNCSYDPIRQESTNPFCPTCGGKGVVQTPTSINIPSSVETYEDITYQYNAVGRLQQGEIKCTIDKQEITNTLDPTGQFNFNDQGSIKQFLDQYDYFIWNSATYVVEAYQGAYLEGNFYEIDITLKLKDDN